SDDSAARHIERYALEDEDDVIVDHLDIVDAEDVLRGIGAWLRFGRLGFRRERHDGSACKEPLPAGQRGEAIFRIRWTCRRLRCASAGRSWRRHSPWRPGRSAERPCP